MTQIYNYGRPMGVSVAEGASSSKKGIPLGQEFSDGQRKFRWAYIADAAVHGQTVRMRNTAPKKLACASSHFTSAVDVDGYGGSIGDTKIRLYGVSAGLTDATLYEDGTFEVYSGTGKGYSYPIDHVQIGRAGTHMLVLKEGLHVGMTSTFFVKLRANKYRGLAVCSAYLAGSSIPVGALTDTITTSGYQLIQTKGVGMGLGGASVTEGTPLYPGVSGLLLSASFLSGECFAHALELGGDGKYFAVDWDFE